MKYLIVLCLTSFLISCSSGLDPQYYEITPTDTTNETPDEEDKSDET